MIGAFYQPQAVLSDLSTLKTLPERELSAGMAEVIKYSALGDIGFFEWLEQNMADLMAQNQTKLARAVYHCCKMKADIVAQDETEQGIRAWLNLGHTFGHAIEAEMGYGVWLHGEAVAAGCVLAARLSEVLGKTTENDTRRIAALLEHEPRQKSQQRRYALCRPEPFGRSGHYRNHRYGNPTPNLAALSVTVPRTN